MGNIWKSIPFTLYYNIWKKHDELKEIADICLRLRYTNMWRDADIEEFMSNYANITVSSSYEEEVMIDCY